MPITLLSADPIDFLPESELFYTPEDVRLFSEAFTRVATFMHEWPLHENAVFDPQNYLDECIFDLLHDFTVEGSLTFRQVQEGMAGLIESAQLLVGTSLVAGTLAHDWYPAYETEAHPFLERFEWLANSLADNAVPLPPGAVIMANPASRESSLKVMEEWAQTVKRSSEFEFDQATGSEGVVPEIDIRRIHIPPRLVLTVNLHFDAMAMFRITITPKTEDCLRLELEWDCGSDRPLLPFGIELLLTRARRMMLGLKGETKEMDPATAVNIRLRQLAAS